MLKRHNPNYKLVEGMIYDNGKYVNLVYGISNDGDGEGLEAYYYKSNNKTSHFYRSYRWDNDNIPQKFKNYYDKLKSYVDEVPNGHKLTIERF